MRDAHQIAKSARGHFGNYREALAYGLKAASMSAKSRRDIHVAVGGMIKRGPMPPLSSLFRDPFLRDAFKRAERDHGHAFAVPVDPPRTLDGGAAEVIEHSEEVTPCPTRQS